MTKLISNSEKTTWLSLHSQLCCVTLACHITSLSPGLLREGGVVSEPAGELVCGQHFPSSLSRPSLLGPGPSQLMPLLQGRWPGTWQPREQATGLSQGPPPGDRQSDRLQAAPSLPRRPWAGPGLPAWALPGGGQADSRGPLPRAWRLALGRHCLGLGGSSEQGGLWFPCPSPLQ